MRNETQTIINRLDEIIELLTPINSDVIQTGDKVNFQGKNYYYIDYSESYYNLGNKFLVAQVGVSYDKVEEIKKGWVEEV